MNNEFSLPGVSFLLPEVGFHGRCMMGPSLAADRVLYRCQTIKQCLVNYLAKYVPAFNVHIGLLAKTVLFWPKQTLLADIFSIGRYTDIPVTGSPPLAAVASSPQVGPGRLMFQFKIVTKSFGQN